MASLTDIDSIMKAAQEEVSSMSTDTVEIVTSSAPPAPNTVTLSEMLNTQNINDAVNQLQSDPDSIAEALQQSMSPELMNRARQLAAGGNQTALTNMLNKKGVSMKKLRAEAKEKKKLHNKVTSELAGPTQSVVLITQGRQHKVKQLHKQNLKDEIIKLIGDGAVQLPCSRLCKGPLSDNSVNLWYNTKHLGKNKRTSKLIGFPIGGPAVIVCSDTDLNLNDFLTAEKSLD